MSKKKEKRQQPRFAKVAPNAPRDAQDGNALDYRNSVPLEIERGDVFGRELANWLFPAYLLIILLGFLGISRWGMITSNGVRALFIAINAATLTGFQQNPGLSSLNNDGQWIVLFLVVAGSLFSLIVGALAVVRIARLRFSDLQIIAAALGVEGAVLLVGSILSLASGNSSVSSMLLAASAFGNCGLELGNLPSETSLLTHLLILPLTILGGLGIVVLMECGSILISRRPLSKHSQVVLSMSAWVYAIGFGLLLALKIQAHYNAPALLARDAAAASVMSVQARTGGLPIFPIRQTSAAAQWVVILLMMIGGSSAGAAGGLKTTTLAELIRGVRELLAGRPGRRAMGIAVSWLGIYLAMILCAVILLAYVSPNMTGNEAFFNAVSAISNVGYSITEIPDERRGMFAYCALMLLGRMVPLMILWWMADTTGDGEWGIG